MEEATGLDGALKRSAAAVILILSSLFFIGRRRAKRCHFCSVAARHDDEPALNMTAITVEGAAGRPVAYKLMDGTARVELLGAQPEGPCARLLV